MNYVVIIKILLQLVSFFFTKVDEKQQQELGKDELVQQQLADMVRRTGIAKQISESVDKLDDASVDNKLHDYYRD